MLVIMEIVHLVCILALSFCTSTRAGSIADQMAEITQLCCNQGLAYAKNHTSQDCSSSVPPDVPQTFGSLCISAMDGCCKEYFLKKHDCEDGVQLAISGHCAGTKSDTAQDCCTECMRGHRDGATGMCGDRGRRGGDTVQRKAYMQCCQEVIKGPDNRAAPTTKNVATPESDVVPSICEEYAPNELCAHHCIPVPGSYRCECNPGYMLMPDGRNCKEVQKNRCKPRNPCQHKCNDNGVDVKCSCRRGYQLQTDGRSCKDIDECVLDPPVCLQGTECHNTQGSYKCIPVKKNSVEKGQCPPGFVRNVVNNVCDDIDECSLPKPPCPKYICENTVGGYKCGGILGDPANLPSLGTKPVPSESDEERCPPGFKAGLNEDCEDIDECATNKHDCNILSQFCINVQGSFYCQNKVSKHCMPGFKINPQSGVCEDIDECADTSVSLCRPDQICINVPGAYDCKSKAELQAKATKRCQEGTRLNIATSACEDIDECAEGTHLCDLHQNCLNTFGSHECRCKLGFEHDPLTGACVDLNECATNQHSCVPESQRCDNTIGSYLCVRIISCGTGYVLQYSTGRCEDIDECALGTDNCALAGSDYQCINNPGSYRCVRKRASTSTSTTTPQPEYEYYYDSEEEETAAEPNKTISPPAPSLVPSPNKPPEIEEPSTTTTAKPDPPSSSETPATYPTLSSSPSTVPTESRYPEIDPRINPDSIPDQNSITYDYSPPKTPENYVPSSSELPPTTPYYPETTYVPPTEKSEVPETKQPEHTAPRKPEYTEPRQREYPAPSQPEYIQPEQPDYTEPRQRGYPAPSQPEYIPPGQRDYIPPRQPEYTAPRQPDYTTPRQPEYTEPRQPDHTLPRQPEYPETKQPENTASRQPEYPELRRPGDTEPRQPEYTETRIITTPRSESERPHEVFIDIPNDRKTITGTNNRDGSVFIDTQNVPKNQWYDITGQTEPNTKCPKGFESDQYGACIDVDECVTGKHNCIERTESCRNTIGGYVCDCALGFRRDHSTGACDVTIPTTPSTTPTSTASSPTPPPTSTSSSTPNIWNQWGYSDYHRPSSRPFRPWNVCDVGYHMSAQTGRCEDIDECVNGIATCAAVEVCVNTLGGYRCECPPKWQLDEVRHRCVPTRDTAKFPQGYGNVDTDNPPEYSPPRKVVSVVNGPRFGSPGHKFVEPTVSHTNSALECPWGYRLDDDSKCVDINECALGIASCGLSQLCTNLPGGYTCNCPPGHRLAGNSSCEDVDECALAGARPICSEHADCVNTPGSYQCRCHDGFRTAPANDKVCVDVDECTESRSGSLCQHRCNNVWGGYRCTCYRGYRLNADNKTCSDIDECKEFANKNLCVGKCVNEPGSYHCSCPSGYRLSEDKRSCIDIDECETGEAPCAAGGTQFGVSDVCLNTRGGYRCQRIVCPHGYQLENKHRCSKIDRTCAVTDWECIHQPSTYSYNYITFVSKLYIPSTRVDLFTMRGPTWQSAQIKFQLRLVDVNAPPTVKEKADINAFSLIPSSHQAVVSLVRSLEGPQSIELELIMELYNGKQFGGTAVAKIFIYVSEYEF